MLLYLLHLPLVAAYLVAPAVALVIDIRRARRRKRLAPSPAYVGTLCTGIALGTGACVAYAIIAGGRAELSQVALASFLAAGMLFLLKGFDWVLRQVLKRVRNGPLLVIAAFVRALVLFGIGLPYILAAGLTYRPKIVSHDNPQTANGFAFDPVAFPAGDGGRVGGWWIPAEGGISKSTILLCHGMGIGKSSLLPVTRQFVPHGFNVLLFDFRAHGQSGGQITTFGDLERSDVLGAIRWLRQKHAGQSQVIDGVGVETGAAALIAAAASDDPAGKLIHSLVLYDGYDSFARLSQSLARQRFVSPLSDLFGTIGLMLADWQTGADLTDFSPVELIEKVWPRPVFVIDAVNDSTFTFDASVRLFDAATGPRQRRWVNNANGQQLLEDAQTAQAVRQFLRSAQPIPII